MIISVLLQTHNVKFRTLKKKLLHSSLGTLIMKSSTVEIMSEIIMATGTLGHRVWACGEAHPVSYRVTVNEELVKIKIKIDFHAYS